MKLNAYSIYDTASASYQRPFFSQADGEAVRLFGDVVRDKEHPIGKHPKDYSLHRVGMFDDNNGKLIPEDKECLITGIEAIAQYNQVEGMKNDQE